MIKGVLLFSAIAFLLVGCSSGRTTAPANPQEPALPVVLSISGSINEDTEPFTITKSPFYVKWEFRPDDTLQDLDFLTVYVVNTETEKSDKVANVMDMTLGNTVDIWETGTFRLSIGSNGGKYTVQVLGE